MFSERALETCGSCRVWLLGRLHGCSMLVCVALVGVGSQSRIARQASPERVMSPRGVEGADDAGDEKVEIWRVG
eukprot:6185600-Pleurochrysis_carterae.AAC.1